MMTWNEKSQHLPKWSAIKIDQDQMKEVGQDWMMEAIPSRPLNQIIASWKELKKSKTIDLTMTI